MGFIKDVNILKKQKLTLNSLKESYEECNKCKDMFKYLGTWANKQYSSFMVVGQSPIYSTKNNYRNKFEKIYFEDCKNGELLREIFNKVGLNFDSFYITNLCKCVTKDNKSLDVEISFNCFKTFLFNEISIIKPKIIFLLGKTTHNHFIKSIQGLNIERAFLDLSEIKNIRKFLINREIGIIRLPYPATRQSAKAESIKILKKYKNLFYVIDRSRKFNHLHIHNCHSIGDSLIKIDEQAKFIAINHKRQLVTTNHGKLTDTLQIINNAKKYGLKPVIGCEFYYLKDFKKFKKLEKPKERKEFRKINERHIVLIAKNKRGLRNLIKIHNFGWIEGFYYKPHVSLEYILKNHEDLIVLTACTKGIISNEILDGNIEEAENLLIKLKKVFKDDLYVEIPLINFDKQIEIADDLIRLAKKHDVQTVVSNDVHYLKQSQYRMRSFLYKMKYGDKYGNDMTSDLHFKSYIEMRDYWKKFYRTKIFTENIFEKSIDNVIKILDEVETIELKEDHRISLYVDSKEIFIKKLKKALQEKIRKDKFSKNQIKIYKDRLVKEIKVIYAKQLVDYFLIISDIINHVKEKYGKEFVGPGRGSAAGSLINNLLNITTIDPIKHNLLFERFLNPEREDLADIDIDFATSIRSEILNYIENKYGANHVLHIGAHGYLKLKNTIQDVSRYFKIPTSEIYALTTKIFDVNESDSLDDLREEYKILDDYLKKHNKYKLEKYIESIRNTIRQFSSHAAGIIISSENLYETIPIVRTSKAIVSGWQDGGNYRELTEIGYYKYDILGLNNLSVIADTLKLIKERHNKIIDLENISLNDKKVFNYMGDDDYVGIFQLESVLALRVLNLVAPNSFEDYVATNALLRPGPLRAGMVEIYARRKNKLEKYEIHPALKNILERTYGIIIEQEQIMSICNKVGGFNYNEANKFRKALTKHTKSFDTELKRIKEAVSYQTKFIKNAKKILGKDKAKEVFDLILKFVAYGFNRAHAVSYAMISYYEMFLKTNYLLEFYTGILNNVNQGSKNKYFDFDIKKYIISAINHNIKILPPDINKSFTNFIIEKEAIRYGLVFIKNLSEKACNEIIKHRPYKSFKDFFEKVDKFYVNKGKVKSLIFSGAFDKFGDRKIILKQYYELRKEDIKEIKNINLTANEVEGLRFQLSSLKNFKLIRSKIFKDFPRFSKENFDVYKIGTIINRSRWALISLYSDKKMYQSVFVPGKLKEDLQKNKIIMAKVSHNTKGYFMEDYRLVKNLIKRKVK